MLEMVYPNEKAKEIQEIYSYVSIVMDCKIITRGCLTLKIKKKKVIIKITKNAYVPWNLQMMSPYFKS